jgi:hypothetical protein
MFLLSHFTATCTHFSICNLFDVTGAWLSPHFSLRKLDSFYMLADGLRQAIPYTFQDSKWEHIHYIFSNLLLQSSGMSDSRLPCPDKRHRFLWVINGMVPPHSNTFCPMNGSVSCHIIIPHVQDIARSSSRVWNTKVRTGGHRNVWQTWPIVLGEGQDRGRLKTTYWREFCGPTDRN